MGIREFTVAKRGVGLPDYAVRKPVGTVPVGPVYTSTDIAELAARLGSPVTFDRRGNVVWMDDFEGSLAKWLVGTTFGRGEVAISNDHSRSKDFSAKLQTGNMVGDWACLCCSLGLPVISRMGVEFSFATEQYDLGIELSVYLYLPEECLQATIKWATNTSKITYLNSAGGWPELPGLFPANLEEHHFNTVKLVNDFVGKTYGRLLWNNQVIDMSAFPLYHPGGDYPPYLYAHIIIRTEAALTRKIYVDDVIITQNEPPNP